MLCLLKRCWCRELSFVHQLRSLFTLVDRMADNNVFQLSGVDSKAVAHAVDCLKKGEIIALPTDTIFGLAVDAMNTKAIASLYELKGRDIKKPLAICVGCVSDIKRWGVTSDLPKGLLKSLLPGPVTILLNRKDRLNPDLNPGVKKVGIRVPGVTLHPFIQFVACSFGYPIALTSANLSNEPNCIHAEEFKHLWPKLAAVFDASLNKVEEEPPSREGSTIVDLSEAGKFTITRPGVAYTQTLDVLKKFKLEQLT